MEFTGINWNPLDELEIYKNNHIENTHIRERYCSRSGWLLFVNCVQKTEKCVTYSCCTCYTSRTRFWEMFLAMAMGSDPGPARTLRCIRCKEDRSEDTQLLYRHATTVQTHDYYADTHLLYIYIRLYTCIYILNIYIVCYTISGTLDMHL